jgi:hypothetical protein
MPAFGFPAERWAPEIAQPIGLCAIDPEKRFGQRHDLPGLGNGKAVAAPRSEAGVAEHFGT